MTQETPSADDLQKDQVEISAAAASASGASASAATSTSAGGSASSASSSGGPGDQNTDQNLVAELASLQAQLTTAKEDLLRAHADVQNARRRAEQDVEKAHKFALEKFVGDMLPVADNMQRSIAAAKDQAGDFTAVAEGVELTFKTLQDALQRHKVVAIDPHGEPFDPQLHQAMTAIENGEVEPNTVIDVFQLGYTLSGRLVRPAMVVVSKAPAGE